MNAHQWWINSGLATEAAKSVWLFIVLMLVVVGVVCWRNK